MDRYLQHYGILGQKWGVRRYENKDGTLTEEGKKRYKINKNGRPEDRESAKLYLTESKKMTNRMINSDVNYSEEFDKTKFGASLRKEYDKAYKQYFEKEDPTEEDDLAFSKIEEKYLRASGEYCAGRLIDEYGDELAYAFANRFTGSHGKETVEAMSDLWVLHRM